MHEDQVRELSDAATSFSCDVRRQFLEAGMDFPPRMTAACMIIADTVLDAKIPREKWLSVITGIQMNVLTLLENVTIVKATHKHDNNGPMQ